MPLRFHPCGEGCNSLMERFWPQAQNLLRGTRILPLTLSLSKGHSDEPSEAAPYPLTLSLSKGGRETQVRGRLLRQDLCWVRSSSHRLNERWLSPERLPAKRPSTLRSSSRSGKWMPSPSQITRQLLRSCEVPWRRRGNQARGIERARPSARSIVRVSSVMTTCCTGETLMSVVEVFIPYDGRHPVSSRTL